MIQEHSASSTSVREYETNYRARPCALDAYLKKRYFNFKDSFKLKRLNQFNVRKILFTPNFIK